MNGAQACDDKDALIGYLYGESAGEELERVENHLAQCGRCRSELDGLRTVRDRLVAWTPPERAPGFRLAADGSGPLRPSRSRWALAAAAVLVLAAGAGIANLDLRYGPAGFAITTGWSRAAVPTEGAALRDPAPWRTELSAMETRLRRELAPSRAGATPLAAASGPSRIDADVLRRVRSLIDESERRQQRELVLRVSQVVRDVEAQRREDLVRIERGLGQLEGITGAEAARQRELLNYLVRVSQRQ